MNTLSAMWKGGFAAIVLAALPVPAFAAEETAGAVDAAVSTNDMWSIGRFRREFCGEDTWEPFNRSMFAVFDWSMSYVVDPFCYLYSSIVPKPLIKGIDNFSENLESPCRIFSNLFMGEWTLAWNATERFLVNTTVGVGGLFDPAENWLGIPDDNASLTDVFTRWGVPSGPQLALPFVPRTSVRGHVGYALDYAFDLKTWFDFMVPSGIFLGYSWALTPNKAPVWRGGWASVFDHAEDAYDYYMPVGAALNEFNIRQTAAHAFGDWREHARLRMQARELAAGSAERAALEARAAALFGDVRPPVHAPPKRPKGLKGAWREIPGYAPRGPSLDSLRALCFSPVGDNDFWWERRSIFNRDFSKRIDERSIEIAKDLPKAMYSFVASADGRGPATKLVIILPGIGAGRTASDAVAMAELVHAHGYAVVICDSLFHWEHMRSVNRGQLPGHLVEDVARYADYLGRILADLKADGLVREPEVSVMGWSMGGLTTAHLAAMDVRDELSFPVRRFVAINIPASLEHVLARYTPVVRASSLWTKEQARVVFAEAAPALYAWGLQTHPRYDPADPPKGELDDPWDYTPNITEEQAAFLLVQGMRAPIQEVLMERQRHHPFACIKSECSWFRRREFYDEIANVLVEDYIDRFLSECYEGVTTEAFFAAFDLRKVGAGMARNAKLSLIHTWDDPLETDEDRRYIDDLFGSRVTWFAVGAHCGYFYTKPFEDELVRFLSGQHSENGSEERRKD